MVLGHAAIERIATGSRFTEGPAYYGDGRYLLFSDIPNDRLLRWDEITGATAIPRDPAGYPDGNTRDRQGRLITCELGSRTLTRTEHDGTVTVLASAFEGTRLTGPNDVVVKSDHSIWFSDNGAGIRGNYLGDKAPQELPFRVYRLDPASGALTIAVGDMERPNGLCFSPDESKLYVVDTPGGTKTTHVYDMVDGKAVNGRVFFDGTPGYAERLDRCNESVRQLLGRRSDSTVRLPVLACNPKWITLCLVISSMEHAHDANPSLLARLLRARSAHCPGRNRGAVFARAGQH